jgi:hypothetical protein
VGGEVSDDRRRIQGDDDRALRSRVRTPAGGVAVDLDDPDTLRDLDRDPADLTPVGDVAARYSPELAGLLVEIERRLSYRVQQVTARAPLGDADRERLEGEIATLRRRLHDVERIAADAMGGHALHGQHDRSEFARVDARINALVGDIADVAQWQRDRAAKDEKAADGRWKLYTAAASGLIAALVPAILALIAATRAGALKDAALTTIVEDQRDHEERLRALERSTTWRARTHSPPVDVPAPTPSPGDSP